MLNNNSPIVKQASSHKLPFITLVVLGVIILTLMFVGYESFLGTNASELTKADKLKNEEITENDLPDAASIAVEVQTDNPAIESDSASISASQSVDLEQQKKEAEAEIVPVEKENIPEGKTHSYTVGKGETFLGIASRFGLKFDQLKALNPGVEPAGLKVGITRLNVKVKAIHTVGPGDVLRVVAEKYHVSKESIMKVNRKDQDITLRGEELIIPLN
jgi:LysM repeat protein